MPDTRSPPAVLITRPAADAGPVADAIAARGFDAVIAPLIEIVIRDRPLETGACRALVFTSANGVRACAANTGARTLPVYAVGAATAAAARDAGFAEIRTGAGDVDSLAGLIAADLPPDGPPLLHVAGSAVAKDLAALLAPRGFRIDRAVLYEARPASVLPPAARTAMQSGRAIAALFFSPRTAKTFVQLTRCQTLGSKRAALTTYCLSPAVAAVFESAGPHRIRIAETPTQAALLAAFDRQPPDRPDPGLMQDNGG